MQLPFTHAQFLDIFADYNRALWPVVAALWLATAVVLAQWYRTGPAAGRLLIALLAFHWSWSGVAYHLVFFRRINPAALLFGTAFVLQAALLLWRGRTNLAFGSAPPLWNRLGIGLTCYALVYPFLGLLAGLRYPRMPSFGVPCPTTILTAGLLLTAPRGPGWLAVIPALWAGIGGSAAFLLGIRADLALPVAGVLLGLRALGLAVAKH